MDDDVETLGWARGRWSLHHPVPGVSDWTVVVWPSATVRREVRVRAADESEAMGRGIVKAYGTRCSLAQDSGLPRGYGQIVRSLSESERRRRASGTTWAADCITGRVRVTVA